MVEYTVSYVDQNGAQLLDSETHYGVIGDKPIVSYKYVDDAYNVTKTLTANAAAGNAAAGNAVAGNAAANAAPGTAIADGDTPLAINDQDTPLANGEQEEAE